MDMERRNLADAAAAAASALALQRVRREGAGQEDEEGTDVRPTDDTPFVYTPPPNNQGVFAYDGYEFDSRFDSGNLRVVERIGTGSYHLWTAPDNFGTSYETGSRTWFYFSVTGGKRGTTITLSIRNVPDSKMYHQGWQPIISCPPARTQGVRMPGRVLVSKFTENGDNLLHLTFEYTFEFDGATVFFSNAYPYTYSKLQRQLSVWDSSCNSLPTESATAQSNSIYYHKEHLTNSLDGRVIEMVTISGKDGMSREQEPQLDAHTPRDPRKRAMTFPGKQYVFITGRVHPGETPASHILHGCMEFLLSRSDPRAAALREHYVFVFIPMLNPDGVYRGHSRADTLGQNLNRMYRNPNPQTQPSIYAARKLVNSLHSTGRLAMYIDMHAHSNKRGVFFYGNAMHATAQLYNLLFAKLISINSPYFDFGNCNFSEGNMFAKGKNGQCKDGSGRVAMFIDTGFVHCYTMESGYICGNAMNSVAGINGIPGEEGDYIGGAPSPKYTPQIFIDMGKAIVLSILDLHGKNPCSRLPNTSFRNMRGVALWIQRQLFVEAWDAQRTTRTNSTPTLVLSKFQQQAATPTFSKVLPPVVTTKASRVFPPTTVYQITSIEHLKNPPPQVSSTTPVLPPGVANASGTPSGSGSQLESPLLPISSQSSSTGSKPPAGSPISLSVGSAYASVPNIERAPSSASQASGGRVDAPLQRTSSGVVGSSVRPLAQRRTATGSVSSRTGGSSLGAGRLGPQRRFTTF